MIIGRLCFSVMMLLVCSTVAIAQNKNKMMDKAKKLESSLATYPMLRLDPEFMVSAIAVYASMRDPRAAILADQMLEAEMNDGQRRILIMTQVKIKLNAGDLPAAGAVYKRLKALARHSDEAIEAREMISAAVIRRGRRKDEG
jgi:hypothetical protein